MNKCENYIKRYNTGGLKPCEKKAHLLLIYYNKLEDAVKRFFLCKDCYSNYGKLNHEYIASPESKVVFLDDLLPKNNIHSLKFKNILNDEINHDGIPDWVE